LRRRTIAGCESDLSPKIYHLPGFYEPFSVVSHLGAAVLFVILGSRLLKRGRGDGLRQAVLGVYAGSCIFLFTVSGIYHMLAADSPARAMMVRIDHSAIFVLIAGTYTPVHGILFQGWARFGPIALIWAAASAGISTTGPVGWDLACIFYSVGWGRFQVLPSRGAMDLSLSCRCSGVESLIQRVRSWNSPIGL
jgi:hemolysin III